MAIVDCVGTIMAQTTGAFDFPRLLAGCYLWQASLGALTIGAVALALVSRATEARMSSLDVEASSIDEPNAAADDGRDAGFSGPSAPQRGRRR